MNNKLNFLLAYSLTFIYFLSVALILKIINGGTKELSAFLIYYSLYGSIILIIGCLIIENIIANIHERKNLMILFVGFLYGLILSFIFGVTGELNTIFINLIAGLISSIGFIIYYYIRQRRYNYAENSN